jgi:hypothetical protein
VSIQDNSWEHLPWPELQEKTPWLTGVHHRLLTRTGEGRLAFQPGPEPRPAPRARAARGTSLSHPGVKILFVPTSVLVVAPMGRVCWAFLGFCQAGDSRCPCHSQASSQQGRRQGRGEATRGRTCPNTHWGRAAQVTRLPERRLCGPEAAPGERTLDLGQVTASRTGAPPHLEGLHSVNLSAHTGPRGFEVNVQRNQGLSVTVTGGLGHRLHPEGTEAKSLLSILQGDKFSASQLEHRPLCFPDSHNPEDPKLSLGALVPQPAPATLALGPAEGETSAGLGER